jgi:ADP-ribosylglycohydrolase
MGGYSEKAKGSLLGAALGDGLGAFAECLHYKTVDRKYGSLPPTGLSGPIDYTDDTSLRLVVYDAILSAPINAFNLAEHWKTKVGDTSVYWTSELFVTVMISMGHDPHRVGHDNLLADNAAMAADPFGVLYPTFDELAALRAFEALSICQSGKGLEGAMAVAAAVSRSMCPEPNMDDVVDAAGKWVGKEMKDRIEKAVSLASSDRDSRRRLYEELLVEDGTSDLVWSDMCSPRPNQGVRRLVDMGPVREDISMSVSPLEVVPVAIGYVAKGKREPVDAIREAASFGRDSDTIAGIAGSILGAYHGVKFLPQDYLAFLPSGLVAKSEEISSRMCKAASRFIEFMEAESVRARKLFAD